ncbi:MAG: hypothetical protein Q9187_007847, partial [Circinaria calcarea]
WPAVSALPFDVNSVTCGDKPRISLPPQLLNYDPLWASNKCSQDLWQGIDPPHALVPAAGFGSIPPFTTVNAPPLTTPASPSSPPPPIAPKTRTTTLDSKTMGVPLVPGQSVQTGGGAASSSTIAANSDLPQATPSHGVVGATSAVDPSPGSLSQGLGAIIMSAFLGGGGGYPMQSSQATTDVSMGF